MRAHVELGVGDGKYALSMRHHGNIVWAYDTFDAKFPIETLQDNEPKGLCASIAWPCNNEVLDTLRSNGIHCVVGVFPASFFVDRPDSVEFVHVDMDTYVSTKAALELFGPLMVPGGNFLVHDYLNPVLVGVKRAVDEFMNSDRGNEYEVVSHADHYCIKKRFSISQTI